LQCCLPYYLSLSPYLILLKIAIPNDNATAVRAKVMQLIPIDPEQMSGVTAPGFAARHAVSDVEQLVVAAPPPTKGTALQITSEMFEQWISPGSWVAS
jgi:hypothetical protein